MRILVVARDFPKVDDPLRGIFEFDQAKALKEFGHEVIYVSIDLRSLRRKRRLGFYSKKLNGIQIFNASIPLGRIPRPLFNLVGKFALLKLFRRVVGIYGKPDVVHAHFSSTATIASVLKKKYKVPFVITEHSSHINKSDLRKDQKQYGEVFSKADKLITVSTALANKVLKHFDIHSQVIPNIVDVRTFKYNHERLNRDGFLFLSIGTLNFNKGFDTLIKAFKKASFNEKVYLKIIGEGPMRSKLQRLIDELELNSQVNLEGFLDRKAISEQMKNSDAFVLSSRSETFGLVYVEALLSGLPVIATKCGGPEDFIDDSNGKLVSVDDVDELSDALIDMSLSNDLFDKEQISIKAIQKFSPEKIASELTSVYKEIV